MVQGDICCRWDQSPSEGAEADCDPEGGASNVAECGCRGLGSL